MALFKEYDKNRRDLTCAHSITCRVFTTDEDTQKHCQAGNVKLELDRDLEWIVTKS